VSFPVRLVGRPGMRLGLVLAGLGAVGALCVALLGLDRLPVTICLLKASTGFPCLTCGGTRAAARLATLDLGGAFQLNPLVTVAGLALVPWALADLALWPRGQALALDVDRRAKPWLGWLAIVLALANWAWLLYAGR
jgi:hypothetical protein